MNPEKLKLNQKQTEEALVEKKLESDHKPLEFKTVEEMLRFDAEQTVVPQTLEKRLKDSLSSEQKQKTSWWQNLFFRKP